MATELSSKYDPQEVEERWYKLWESRGYFKADPSSNKPPFSVVIPPPNVTGSLHIGHALNNALQDVLVRRQRMLGFDVLWVPGCDHAGIATQNVVERELAKEGKNRDDLGREKFIERVWQWKEESGSTIMRQLRRLGASCDWSYERFTFDEGLSKAVQEVFIRLYEKGLIYQGDYIINWCPRCSTALSDIEAQHKDVDGKLYYVRYPVVGQAGKFVVVATTRPETIPGDVAVCVHPDDERFAALKGARLAMPILGKEIPLIADGYVDRAFGTGALKITPAHDANDFEIGDRFGLERVKIMDPKGIMNELAGPYKGMDRFACRKAIVRDLESAGLLEKVEEYKHAVARCYRCETVVESYLSKQWFVKMKPLAERALAALEKGDTSFQPANWSKVYSDWLKKIRDWCVSRQIWWGHRIPVYYTQDGRPAAARSAEEAAVKLGVPAASLTQDPDVLDTWFSSALWPFSTMGWPESTPELARYYPTSVLVTSWDILFFWVARMSMFGLEVVDQVPFKKVLINSLVADEHGQKMSKSKGNVIDPLTKIDTIGADALRFALLSVETQSRYISLSEERLESARNFTNKIWNAARFMLLNLKGLPATAVARPQGPGLELVDRWILTRLDQAIVDVDQYMEDGVQINHVAATIFDFFWKDLCDWYIEAAKVRLQSEDAAARTRAQEVLAYTLETTLRLLHPLCPFITEEIWQRLPHQGETIMLAPWPAPFASVRDTEALAQFQQVLDVVHAVREIRGEMKVDAKKVVSAILAVPDKATLELLMSQRDLLESFAKMTVSAIAIDIAKPEGAASAVAGAIQVYLPLADLLDLDVERRRLAKEIERLRGLLGALEAKLSNEAFVQRAPVAVVETEKKKIVDYRDSIEKLSQNLQGLGA